jgi:hypothetical protein
MDGHIEQKEQKEKVAASTKVVDRFSMTKEQKEKESLTKMDIVNKKLAAVMGIDFTDFED